MCTGKEAVYPQFFLQLGEEPPAFVVRPFTLRLLCAATVTIALMRSLQADGTSEKLRPTLTKGEPAN